MEPTVTRHSFFFSLHHLFVLLLLVTFSAVAPLSAQAQEGDDDDAKLRPAEPDFTLINLPTTLPLPVHGGNFHLTHRFAGNLRQGSFSDNASSLFGLDRGAFIGLEYRFGVVKHLEAAVYRTSFDKTFQFYGKYDAVHQDTTHPIGISGLVSIEGTNNFQEHYAPSLGASVSYVAPGDRLAVYAVPVWAHNSAAALSVNRDTFYVGLGGRLRFL